MLVLLLFFLLTAAVRGELEDGNVRRSEQVLLLNVTLDASPKQFLDTLWHDPDFFARFLAKTGDVDVDVPKAWVPSASAAHSRERTVVTRHPVKTRVPGMGIPSHVKSTKRQVLTEEKGAPFPSFRLLEENVVEGVPFSDKFHVKVDWQARWLRPPPAAKAKHLCRLEVFSHVVYTGRFLLEGVVARNSASETGETLKIWEGMALEHFPRVVTEDLECEKKMVVAATAAAAAGDRQPSSSSAEKKKKKEPGLLQGRRMGVWITALCTSLLLLVQTKLPGLLGGAGASGGIH